MGDGINISSKVCAGAMRSSETTECSGMHTQILLSKFVKITVFSKQGDDKYKD